MPDIPGGPVRSGGAAAARPLLVGSEIYRHSTYGGNHPLAIPRVSTALDLIRALGWMDPARYLDSPRAAPEQLSRFHTPEYVAALQAAEAAGTVSQSVRERHHLGAHGNPVYREVFRRPATGAGGAMLAARLTVPARPGTQIVHVPGAGTHHAMPDRASGFCYLNDVALALFAWLDAGLSPLLYVDIDAHHGDGVEHAFRDEPRVTTLSVHERDRWPRTGAVTDRGALGNAWNVPVPENFNDDEMRHVLDQVVLPLAQRLRPQGIVLQCGADALQEDPLSRLSLSNNAHFAVARALSGAAPRLIVSGGGGYNPWTVGRCWAGVWGTLDGREIPDRLPDAAVSVLEGLSWFRAAGRNPPRHWLTTLHDVPRPGPVRAEVREACRAVWR